ncbi:MAG: 5-formyltetrahydrofolate cyclo-ligase [Rhodocyclaceae bacterium]|nr:5-formyltetrahydrofolate cyclo-ligase [Rhodocyclaceae bacterium]
MVHSTDNLIDPVAQRSLLRRRGIASREAMPAETHALLSAHIESHLDAELLQHAPAMLGFCWPFRGEFDARPLVTRLLGLGWQACLPVVGETIGPMVFRQWTPDTPMQADKHGIATPQQGAFVVPDILLLPFNVIDARGYRLGYGAGYFDRTLAVLDPRPFVIGVGFGLGVVASVYPQPHDIPVNCRVTETGICHF